MWGKVSLVPICPKVGTAPPLLLLPLCQTQGSSEPVRLGSPEEKRAKEVPGSEVFPDRLNFWILACRQDTSRALFQPGHV